MESAVEARLVTKTSAQWDAIFADHGAVAGGVRDVEAVLETGQPAARQLLGGVMSGIGEIQVTNAGYLFDDEPFAPRGDLPNLGGDTRAVLESLGYSASKFDDLSQRGVIGVG